MTVTIPEPLLQFYQLIQPYLPWLTLGGILMAVASAIVIPYLIVQIPADYFLQKKQKSPAHPLLKLSFRIIRNVIAFFTLLAGLLMLILPGQGLLTIFIALLISDFSGKYKLEQAIISQEKVFNSINWVRRRYGHPDLIHPKHNTDATKIQHD